MGNLGLMVSRKQPPAELAERAVAMVFLLRVETGSTRGTLASMQLRKFRTPADSA